MAESGRCEITTGECAESRQFRLAELVAPISQLALEAEAVCYLVAKCRTASKKRIEADGIRTTGSPIGKRE